MSVPAVFLAVLAALAVQPEPADLALRGGAVYTVDASRSWAEAVAIRDGRIVYVGTGAGLAPFVGADTEVVELSGGMVLPGFHDSHVHAVTGGIELGQCDLNGLESREAVFAAVRRYAQEHPELEWIVGGGWDLPIFEGGSPHRSELDRLAPDRPAYLSSADGHSAWVNSRALAAAGIDADTPDPVNGRIERDPETGAPTGTLRESAMALVAAHLPVPDPADDVEGLRRGLEVASGFGITSIIEANATDRVVAAYQSLSRSGELTVRTTLSLATDDGRGEEQVDDLLRRRDAVSGPRLRAAGVKIFADGVIEAQTAALLAPYEGLDHAGELTFAPEALERLVVRLDREGFQVHIHAIGDRAIRASLDAFEESLLANGARDARHHLAHIQLFDPEDIPRLRRLGIVANFQPLWAYADAYITDLTEPVLGEARSRWLYPIRSVEASGAVVAAGSDWSVSSMDPLDAIQVAVTRKGLAAAAEAPSWIPEERASLPTMLAAYTIAGAYLQHQESLTGSIEVGKAADLVVLDRNLFEIDPSTIHEARVVLTLLDGAATFRGSDSDAPDR